MIRYYNFQPSLLRDICPPMRIRGWYDEHLLMVHWGLAVVGSLEIWTWWVYSNINRLRWTCSFCYSTGQPWYSHTGHGGQIECDDLRQGILIGHPLRWLLREWPGECLNVLHGWYTYIQWFLKMDSPGWIYVVKNEPTEGKNKTKKQPKARPLWIR